MSAQAAAALAVHAAADRPECTICAQHHSDIEEFARGTRHYPGCKCGWQYGASFATRAKANVEYSRHLTRSAAHECPVDAWLERMSVQ